MIVGVVGLVIFIASFFFSALSGTAIRITRPLLFVGSKIPGVPRVFGWFEKQHTLIEENEALKQTVAQLSEEVLIKNVFLSENIQLKEALGRTTENESTLVNILARPDRTPHDTFVVDGGLNLGLAVGDLVVGNGSTAIGIVEEVYGTSAKIRLFSAYNVKTDVLLGADEAAVTLVGHGNGNFILELPKDVHAEVGDVAVLPGISPRVVAVVGNVTAGTDTSLEEVLLVMPANTTELSQLFVIAQK